MKRLGLYVGVGLILAACQSTTPEPELTQPPTSSSLDELASLSVEARHELRLLAKAQESLAQQSMSAEQHDQRFRQATYVPEGFDQPVTFNFTGPASEAAKVIGELAQYEVIFDGAPHASEPFVRIRIDGGPLNDALRELGMQTGSTIRVEVHPAANLMRFVYL